MIDWEAIAVIVAAGSVIYGVNAWRREFVGKRNIEFAEEVLATFYESRDVIDTIRNIFGSVGEGSSRIPAKNESKDETEIYNNAYVVFERYQKHSKLFNKLYAMRYRYMARFGARFGKEASKPFDDLHSIINEIFIAANMLRFYWLENRKSALKSKEERKLDIKMIREQEAIIWKQGSKDTIVPRVNTIITLVEEQTHQIIK